MPIPYVLLIAALAAALGYFSARTTLASRYRREAARREREMTSAVEERLRAYVALEAQVRRLLGRMDELEQETASGLARTGMRLRDLGTAVAAAAGETVAPEPTSTSMQRAELHGAGPQAAALDLCDAEEALGWMDSADSADSAAVEVQLDRAPAATEPFANLDAWEQRIEGQSAEKRAELDRQERVVADLTARLAGMQAKLVENDNERGANELRYELDLWRERHLALERESAQAIARVRARADQAGELEAELEEALTHAEKRKTQLASLHHSSAEQRTSLEHRIGELEAHAREEQRGHAESARALERRIRDLEPFVERERAACAELAHWQATSERLRVAMDQSAATHNEQLAASATELREVRVCLEAELETLDGRRIEQAGELAARMGELERLRPELEHACLRVQEYGTLLEERADRVAFLEAECAQLERSVESRGAQIAQALEELESARAQVQHWRQRTEEAEAEREARVRELDTRLGDLEELSELLRDATQLHLGRIGELETEEARLERDLLERTQSLTATKERLEQAEFTLATVSKLLRDAHAKGE